MKVSKVELIPIRPKNGLIAFACIELDHQFFVNSIGVHKKLNKPGFRITYPSRKIGEQSMTICHPIENLLSKEIEEAICLKAELLMEG